MGNLQKAQEFARKHGYTEKVAFLRRWHNGEVYTIDSPQDEDFGEPLVVVVERNGSMSIRSFFEIR